MAIVPPEEKQNRGAPYIVEGKCGGRLANSNPARYCLNDPEPGRNRCRFHGGRNPRGINHWRYKQGLGKGLSMDMPARLIVWLEEASQDPDLTSLRPQHAAVLLRFYELLGQLDDSGLTVRTRNLRSSLDDLEEALDEDDVEIARQRMEEIRDLLIDNENDRKLWGEIQGITRTLRELAEAENKRDYMRDKSLSPDEARLFFGAIVRAVIDGLGTHLEGELLDRVRSDIDHRIKTILRAGKQGYDTAESEHLVLETTASSDDVQSTET